MKKEIQKLKELLEKDNKRRCWCTETKECGCDSMERWIWRNHIEKQIEELREKNGECKK